MRIRFIRPNLADVRATDAMQPLVFAILAALTPSDVELELVDERLEPIRFDDPVDLVAITVETFTARNAYQIAARFRRRKVPVVMGGFHPTMLPEESLAYADAVVVGDAEGLWPEVVRDAQLGTLRRVYTQHVQPSLAGLMPDRSIFAGRRYVPLPLVQFGRGCRFACDFCAIHAFYDTSVRCRPVAEVVTEIERLGARRVFFVDDNLIADATGAKALCEALAPLGVRWSCQVSIDVCHDVDLLKKMAHSGCEVALIGFESLDARNLQQMKKQWGLTHHDYGTSIQRLRDLGIMVYGTFVFGYDYDTVDSFAVALEFAQRHRFFLANFNPLTPMPGTHLYERLRLEGRLIYDRWWLASEFRYGQAVFHPRRMTAQELTDGCFRRGANSTGTVRSSVALGTGARIAAARVDWLVTCWETMISRREIFRKQGLALGSDGPLEQE